MDCVITDNPTQARDLATHYAKRHDKQLDRHEELLVVEDTVFTWAGGRSRHLAHAAEYDDDALITKDDVVVPSSWQYRAFKNPLRTSQIQTAATLVETADRVVHAGGLSGYAQYVVDDLIRYANNDPATIMRVDPEQYIQSDALDLFADGETNSLYHGVSGVVDTRLKLNWLVRTNIQFPNYTARRYDLHFLGYLNRQDGRVSHDDLVELHNNPARLLGDDHVRSDDIDWTGLFVHPPVTLGGILRRLKDNRLIQYVNSSAVRLSDAGDRLMTYLPSQLLNPHRLLDTEDETRSVARGTDPESVISTFIDRLRPRIRELQGE